MTTLTPLGAFLFTDHHRDLSEFERRELIRKLQTQTARDLPVHPCTQDGRAGLRIHLLDLSPAQTAALSEYLAHLAAQPPSALTAAEAGLLRAFPPGGPHAPPL